MASEDSSNNWFYMIDGVQEGPVEAAELKRMARSGRLLPTDLVQREGKGRWVPGNSVKGLFASPEPPPPPPPPPPTKEEWHVSRGGQASGPCTLAFLQQMADSEMLRRDDMVWKDGMPSWMAAGSVPGIFNGPPPAPEGPVKPGGGSGSLASLELENLWGRMKKVGWPIMGTLGLLMLVPNGEFHTVAFLVNVITLSVITNLMLYRMWALIQVDGYARTTPGKAIGFRFIPFFNLYWEFVAIKGLRDDIVTLAQDRRLNLPPLPMSAFVWYYVALFVSALFSLVPYLSFLTTAAFVVVEFYVIYLLKNACVVLAQSIAPSREPAGVQSGAGTQVMLDTLEKISELSQKAPISRMTDE